MEREQEIETLEGLTTEEESENQKDEVEEKSIEAQLAEQLQQQQDESRKNYDQYLRALAEVENTKKRALREREEYLKYANVSLIKKLLPIIDDLHRAIDVSRNSKDFEALNKGIEMTARSLGDLIISEGVQTIDSLGKPFDPQYHQALTVEASDEHPENTVIEELQKGYVLHDRVIRPSLVKVSQ